VAFDDRTARELRDPRLGPVRFSTGAGGYATQAGVAANEAWLSDGTPVFAKAVDPPGDALYDPRLHASARREVLLLRHPDVASCKAILSLIAAGPTASGTYVRLYELADGGSLCDALGRPAPGVAAADVRSAVESALAVLHRLRYVHSDVAPNNILSINGRWVLADLDHAVRFGAPCTGVPGERWRDPAMQPGVAGWPAFDHAGLDRVIDAIPAATSA
jgi:hypothetical protein